MDISSLRETPLEILFAEGDIELDRIEAAIPSGMTSELLEIASTESLWDEEAPGGGYAPVRAVRLLGARRPVSAIEPLYLILFNAPPGTYIYRATERALQKYGDAAIGPGVELLEQLGEEFREDLACLFAGLDIRRRVVFQVILKHFVQNPGVGAHNLAEYGDPEGLDALEPVFEKYVAAGITGDREAETLVALGEAIETLGGELSSAERDRIEEARDRQRPGEEVLERVREGDKPWLGEETVVRDRDIGRNDPCWCESGKKYKHCHWADDNR